MTKRKRNILNRSINFNNDELSHNQYFTLILEQFPKTKQNPHGKARSSLRAQKRLTTMDFEDIDMS